MFNSHIAIGFCLVSFVSIGVRADVPAKDGKSTATVDTAPAKSAPAQVAPAQVAPAGPPHEPGKVPGVQKRDAAADPKLIDLTDFYTLGLDEDASGVFGYTLSALPKGVHKLDNTTYDLRGVVQLSSQVFAARRKTVAQSVKGIKVGQKCQKLVFLHASRWIADEGATIGTYTVHYADGKTAEIPIRFGIDLRDWKPQHDPNAGGGKGPAIGWKAQDKAGGDIVLFELTWPNPASDTEISTLDMTSTMTDAAPFLVALTAQ